LDKTKQKKLNAVIGKLAGATPEENNSDDSDSIIK
jgi:hypothetical protein